MRKLLILITLCLPVVVSFIEYEVKAEIETMNQEQLLADIMEERARELVFEGHRWFDLRRTTRPEVIKNYMDCRLEFAYCYDPAGRSQVYYSLSERSDSE